MWLPVIGLLAVAFPSLVWADRSVHSWRPRNAHPAEAPFKRSGPDPTANATAPTTLQTSASVIRSSSVHTTPAPACAMFSVEQAPPDPSANVTCSMTYAWLESTDHDMGNSLWCTCNDGLIRESATDVHRTEECPSDGSIVPPTSTTSYTYTSDLYVVECQYSKSDGSYTTNGATLPYYTCLGSSATLSWPPTMSIMVSTGPGVVVGSLTGDALHTSVSNALISACTGTSWPVTACSSSVAVATGITYVVSEDPDGLSNEGSGTLSLTFGEGIKIESVDQLIKMGNATGAAAAQYVEGQTDAACKKMRVMHENPGHAGSPYFYDGKIDVCSIPQSMIFEWVNGTLVAPGFVNDRIWVSFEFTDDHTHKTIDWLEVVEDVCETAMGIEQFVTYLVGIFIPEVLPELREVTRIVNAVCEAAIGAEHADDNF